jgi:hypothetical protein
MKKLFLFCGLGFSLSLTGCFQSDTLVVVNPDGSGTVTETFVLGKDAMNELKQRAARKRSKDGTNKTPAKPFEVMDEQKLRADGAKMGEGVTFVSAKKIMSGDGAGYTVTYAYRDINKLKINKDKIGGALNSYDSPAPGRTEPPDYKPQNMTFEFHKGLASELIIHSPVQPPAPANGNKTKKKVRVLDPDQTEVMAQILGRAIKDMKIDVVVQVAGKIVKTDAKFLDGSKVTLLAMDFNKLLAEPAKLKALAATDSETIEDRNKYLAGFPGMKVELRDKVTVSFK